MGQEMLHKELHVEGMICDSSEKKIEEALNKLDGVENVKASYEKSNVYFFYDTQKITPKSIANRINSLGYLVTDNLPDNVVKKQVQSVPQNASGALIRKVLSIGGMSCINCEMRIENRLKKLEGIKEVKVSYTNSTAKLAYDPKIITMQRIVSTIEKLDYTVKNRGNNAVPANKKGAKKNDKMSIMQLIGIGVILLAVYLIIKNTVGFNFIPSVTQNMGYGILFVIGLITSIHCVAMCGGINLSQCVSYKYGENDTKKMSKLKPSLMYNMGRVISYTIIGGIVGALGSVVSFSGTAKGIIALISGVFMVIMGLNMLDIFPWLRRFNLHMPKIFGSKIHNNNGKHGPFYVGLLNGLMPCGPLQAMQIYALGTGSFFAGAISMFIFSLGTVPLMFGFGALSSLLSGKFTHKMMKVSAVLVMILGIVMLNRGFALSGINFLGAVTAKAASSSNVAKVVGNEQDVTTKLQSNSYTPFVVQKGIPVKWTIQADASTINGCNGTVTIPTLNIVKPLQPGDNVINFTPTAEGTITYTCSMGMISSTITVVSDVSKVAAPPIQQTVSASGGSNSSSSSVGVAKISGKQQVVTVAVGSNGYTPSILVVQKGIPAQIKFTTGQLSSCNSLVIFPTLNSELDLSSQKETPVFTPQSDFTFHCGMGMLSGYVKVVDDINNIDINAIKQEAKNFVSTGGGMACCQ